MPITQAQTLRLFPDGRPGAGVFVTVLKTATGKYQIVTRLFRRGFKCSKCEVLLMDLSQPGEFPDAARADEPELYDEGEWFPSVQLQRCSSLRR